MTEQAAAELDAAHALARQAFARKDLDAYREMFSPDLSYRQANGEVIGRDRLMRDVAAQLASVESAETEFVREDLSIEDGSAVELLRQAASVTMIHFLLFRRRISVERRGRYTWTRDGGRWRIVRVEVLEESVRVGRLRLRFLRAGSA